MRNKWRNGFIIFGILVVAAVFSYWSFDSSTPEVQSHSELAPTPTQPQESTRATVQTPKASVTGFVLDAATRRGIANADVLLDGINVVSANEHGAFTIPALENGQYTITAKAPRYVGPPPTATQGTTIRVDADTTLEGVELYLRRAASLEGLVLANGKPVSDAHISVIYDASDGTIQPFGIDTGTISDENGRFHLTALFSGQLRILVEHDRYALFESDSYFIEDGENISGVEIHLTSGAILFGRVHDPSGRPVDNVSVWIAGDDYPRRELIPDADGHWRVIDLTPGRFKVYATAVGFRPAEAGPFEVEVGGNLGPITLTLYESPGFGGRVVSSVGEPVAEAVVYYRPKGRDTTFPKGGRHQTDTPNARMVGRTYTDENGEFWVHTPLLESVDLTATHTRHAPSETVSLTPGGLHRVELRLGPGGSLTGLVSAADTRKPVQNYDVAIVSFQPFENTSVRGGGFGRIQVADSGGRFLFDGLTPGTYSISVIAVGYIAKRVDNIDVRGGIRTGDLRITLERGGALAGLIVDAQTQQPVSGAQVQANTLYDLGYRRGGPSVQTGSDGRFLLEGLPGGPRSLTVGKSGYTTQITSGHEVPAVGTNDIGTIQLAAETEETRGKYRYSGIGTVLKKDGDRLLISELVETGSASAAGIEPGTEIVAVNGRSVTSLPMAEVVELIRGKEGTDISLTVLAPNSNYAEKIDLRRETVTMRQER